jgi:hypothetical protein
MLVEQRAMADPLTLSITSAKLAEGDSPDLSLDLSLAQRQLDRTLFYLAPLGAVASEATELRYEPRSQSGKVWCKVDSVDYEMVSMSKKVPEQEIRSLAGIKRNRARTDSGEVRFLLEIGGKTTKVVALFQPPALVFHFLDPATACKEARKMQDNYVKQYRH